MSDDEREWNVPLLGSDMQAYVAEYGAEKPCPDCGVNDWAFFTQGEREHAFSTLAMSNGLVSGVELTPFSCKNCGHTKLYRTDLIRAWRKRRG